MSDEYTVQNPPTKRGIYYNLPDDVYRAIPATSQSTLKRFADCPRRWKLSPPVKPTEAMKFGLLVDNMWLSGDTSRYAVQPFDYDTKRMRCPECGSMTDSKKCAKCKMDRVEVTVKLPWDNRSTTCQEWVSEQEQQGREVVSYDTWQMAKAACVRLDSVPEMKLHRSRCDVQVAVLSEIEGCAVKCLIDVVPHEEYRVSLGDLKVATTADPKKWARYVYDYRLHWQAALSLDLWNKESGENIQWFHHFVVESQPPHEPCYMPLSQDFIALGRRDVGRSLRMWAEAQEKNEFPGYEMNVETQVENWMLR